VGDWLLAGDAVHFGSTVVSRSPILCFHDLDLATRSCHKALRMAPVVVPGHDRPLRIGPPMAYLGGCSLRLRFFAEPGGQDQEIAIACEEAR
jgi:glyoxylase-like metal-dependent hydrolase (beta-lactamase superfamily II)